MRLAERGSGTVTTITQDPVTPAWARISALEASPRWTVRPIARAALTESGLSSITSGFSPWSIRARATMRPDGPNPTMKIPPCRSENGAPAAAARLRTEGAKKPISPRARGRA